SREIVRLLGGEIKLKSEIGRGSTFTVFLPQRISMPIGPARLQHSPEPPQQAYSAMASAASAGAGAANIVVPIEAPSAAKVATAELRSEMRAYTQEFDDDRNTIRPGDQVVLMVENDLTFAALMIEVVRNRGFKGVIATRGAHALNLARELKPTAITLDILLPDCSGFSVLERLKRDATTSYIPVHVISIAEEKTRALALG